MKKVVLFLALAVGLLASASTLQAQTVNMSRYITLAVAKDSAIKLDFKAATEGTPVRIESGSTVTIITVGTSWYNGNDPSSFTITAADTVMTVYGDITSFKCCYNGANHNYLDVSHNTLLTKLWCNNNNLSSLNVSNNTELTELYCSENQFSSLDVSQNTQLQELICYGNLFTTAALDNIYCALPDRTGNTNGVIQPVKNASDPNHATVLATNKQNATAKNWKVQYYYGKTDIPTTTGIYVCGTSHDEPDMSRYITLAVKNGENIKLNFMSDGYGKIRIVSGGNTQVITMLYGGWWIADSCIAGGTTMTVYGNIEGFDCKDNGANITAIDVSHNTWLKILDCSKNQLTALDISHNTQLEKLYCYGNNFSTAAIDDIYCALPYNSKALWNDDARIYPLQDSSDPNYATVAATNAHNAINKNWKVQYYNGNADITTNGTYVCTPNMNSYITLTVTDRADLNFKFEVATNATIVRIVSGSKTRDITLDPYHTFHYNYSADGTKITVYGDITAFSCYANGVAKLTALDISHNTLLTKLDCRNNRLESLYLLHNTQLTELDCCHNKLTSLDVSHNTQLTKLDCSRNQLSSLDVSNNTELTELYCSENQLSSLDVSHNTLLEKLYCSRNQLSSLNVSNNTELTELYCSENQLSSLNVSNNTELTELRCYGNNLSTNALDDIYCSLPVRAASGNAKIYPLESSEPNYTTVIATNAQNAIDKNWEVRSVYGGDITTNGTYVCGTPHTDIAEATAEQAFTLYPNPVADVLYLSATARTIRIYNVYGIEVAHATDTDRIDVANLPAGIYTVKADGTVAKMVKR